MPKSSVMITRMLGFLLAAQADEDVKVKHTADKAIISIFNVVVMGFMDLSSPCITDSTS